LDLTLEVTTLEGLPGAETSDKHAVGKNLWLRGLWATGVCGLWGFVGYGGCGLQGLWATGESRPTSVGQKGSTSTSGRSLAVLPFPTALTAAGLASTPWFSPTFNCANGRS
jgi:hypothetical protein